MNICFKHHKFENPIFHPHDGHIPVIISSAFSYTKSDGTTVSAYFDDDGSGNMRIFEVIDVYYFLYIIYCVVVLFKDILTSYGI